MSVKNLNGIKVIQLLLLGLLLFPSAANAQTDFIDFESDRWIFDTPDGAKVVNYLGRKSLYLKSTRAYLEDLEFENGIIEVDIAFQGEYNYVGINFRLQSNENYEHIVIRPHKIEQPETVQYAPVFNAFGGWIYGVCWQLYPGKGYMAKATVPKERWVHAKIEVSGKQARVYLDGANEPILAIDDLKHGISRGSVGLDGWYGDIYFSNFRVKTDNNLKFEAPPAPSIPPGTIRKWQLSQVFKATQVNPELSPHAQGISTIKWQKAESEASGLVNIARYVKRGSKPEVVFAKTVIHSEREQVKRLTFGYSDEISIFLNNSILFSGNSACMKRGPSFLGLIGLNDAVYLNLKKGNNELLLIITEIFGGWGYICQLEDMKGIEIENDN